jgi:hypothetical protein
MTADVKRAKLLRDKLMEQSGELQLAFVEEPEQEP